MKEIFIPVNGLIHILVARKGFLWTYSYNGGGQYQEFKGDNYGDPSLLEPSSGSLRYSYWNSNSGNGLANPQNHPDGDRKKMDDGNLKKVLEMYPNLIHFDSNTQVSRMSATMECSYFQSARTATHVL